MRFRRGPTERGSATMELAIIGPALLMFIGLMIAGGRITIAGGAVEHAAAEAARSASIARTQAQATSDARSTAENSLNNQGLQCVSLDVAVDAGQFSRPPGTRAAVWATVTCVVGLGDVTIPGLPGSKTLTAQVESPLDTYRERG